MIETKGANSVENELLTNEAMEFLMKLHRRFKKDLRVLTNNRS